jgi:hypothetical protein
MTPVMDSLAAIEDGTAQEGVSLLLILIIPGQVADATAMFSS